MDLLKEFKRQTEIAAFVYENRGKYSPEELCEKFDIAVATLHRDFKSLRKRDVDIRSRKKRVLIDLTLRPLNNLLSMYISICTPNNIRNLKQIREKYKNKTISIFVNILKGITEKRILEINYAHLEENNPSKHVIEPIYLTSNNKSFYLVAFENQEMCFYRLEGIETIHLTSKKFSREIPTFEEIYKYSWGIYSGGKEIIAKLKFKNDKENYFKRISSDEQDITYEPGHIIVEMKVKMSLEYISWILGWGNEIEIISPPELKMEVLLKAKGLLDKNS